MSFTHLHLHTQYSLLDGAIKVKDLVQHTRDYGMNAVAMTDHGNMFGAVDFYKQCKKGGIKPIIGCEVYVSATDRFDRTTRQAYHLVLLARTFEGYRNLVALVSKAHLEGFYYYPRIDKKLLKDHARGLIGMTACLGGEVPSAILAGDKDRARALARDYASLFEPGMFFLELQANGMPEQEQVNDALLELSGELEIPLVATNDCHYLKKEDAKAHEILMCVQTGKTLADEKRMQHDTDEYYFKRPEEMIRAFAHVPEALANTSRIAEMCNVEIPLGKVFLPQYEPPEGHDLVSFLRHLAGEGLQARFAELEAKGIAYDRALYEKRLDHELDVIVQMDFPGYFLIVWDFIRYAREIGVAVGPGRGSGAGSLVAYSLRITDIDPMIYDLLFERFLNPERVSMPDFDIDFCMNRREEVIRYVTEKYGADHVGQIVTFGSLKARGTIRDVARVLGMSYGEGDVIAKRVPEVLNITLDQALEQDPKLKAMYDEDPKVRQVVDVSRALEGLNRHTGMHAAGIVIGDKALSEYVPVFRGGNGELVTQFAKEEVEEAGLVKFDFLGLRTLTVIGEAVRLIRNGPDPAFAITDIPMDDPKVFQLLSSGETMGVFQVESSGFRELMTKLRPDRFEDIIAAVALYRPGPIQGGMVDDFVRRKHGEIAVRYPHPLLKGVLEETYGVIVYQEQVMQIANILAGFSLGEADILRRAMGKKKAKVMEKQRERFTQGAAARGIDARLAIDIFDLVEKFAGYGFNKSHSAAYGLIAYQTAYLKAHFPVEFMAAILTSEKERNERVVKYIAVVRAMGIEVRPPDVNRSQEDFSVTDGAIRFGLGAVKGIGAAAVQAVVEARHERPFDSLFDFCERIDSRKLNRKVLESLVKCGAFDFLGAPRHVLFASTERALDRGSQAQRDRDSGQLNMLDMFGGSAKSKDELVREEDLPPEERWNELQRLGFEKDSLGFYITGHPLDLYGRELGRFVNMTTSRIETAAYRAEVVLAGVVAALREVVPKSGKGRIAFVSLEDREGQVEVVCLNKLYAEAEDLLKSDVPLLVRGSVQLEGEGENRVRRVRAQEIQRLSDVRQERTRRVELRIDGELLTQSGVIDQIEATLGRHAGGCAVRVHVNVPDAGVAVVGLGEAWKVAATDDLVFELERIVGRERILFS